MWDLLLKYGIGLTGTGICCNQMPSQFDSRWN